MQSAAERQTCVELEADALCDEILNRHEVRRTPLRDARADVRLVQSLSQLWREEGARRASHGLPPLDEGDCTPQSVVHRRSTLPPPPAGKVSCH